MSETLDILADIKKTKLLRDKVERLEAEKELCKKAFDEIEYEIADGRAHEIMVDRINDITIVARKALGDTE